MAKNIEKSKVTTLIKRHLNEPSMPYIAENKLDHAMYELKNSRNEVLKLRNRMYLSIFINITFLVIIYLVVK